MVFIRDEYMIFSCIHHALRLFTVNDGFSSSNEIIHNPTFGDSLPLQAAEIFNLCSGVITLPVCAAEIFARSIADFTRPVCNAEIFALCSDERGGLGLRAKDHPLPLQ